MVFLNDFRTARQADLGRAAAALLLGLLVFFARPGAGGVERTAEARCLASTLYWEARGEGRTAMIAVAWVVLNRKKDPGFPDSVCAVVRQGGENPPCQFSYWCDGEPEIPQNDKLWDLAKSLAEQMLKNPPRDPTGGALYFHSGECQHAVESETGTDCPDRRSCVLPLTAACEASQLAAAQGDDPSLVQFSRLNSSRALSRPVADRTDRRISPDREAAPSYRSARHRSRPPS